VVALIIVLIHGVDLKRLAPKREASKRIQVWLSGAVPAGIYSLTPQSKWRGRRLFADGHPPAHGESYLVGEDGELTKGRVAWEAAPLFWRPISINESNAQTLMTVKGISRTISSRIVEYRTLHGQFKEIDELLKVGGVGRRKLAALKKYISL